MTKAVLTNPSMSDLMKLYTIMTLVLSFSPTNDPKHFFTIMTDVRKSANVRINLRITFV